MPTTALHFAIKCGEPHLPKYAYQHLKISYCLSFIFLLVVWISDNFIVGTYEYSWGNFPKTGYLHFFHTAFAMTTAIYMVYIFWRAMRLEFKVSRYSSKYYEYKFLFLGFMFVTFAASDFLHNWGVDFFPIGCFFVALFIACIGYGIFRHKLMGISIAIKQSLVYSILISFVTVIYFSAVFIASKFIGNASKFHSPLFILTLLAVITLILKPLELRIQKFIDKLFYGGDTEKLFVENNKLRDVILKQDHHKAIATLAAGMAHEIKNPLTAIQTFVDYLPSKNNDPEFINKFQRIVGQEMGRIKTIVADLLAFSKPSEPKKRPTDINLLIRDMTELLASQMTRQMTPIKLSLEASPSICDIDPDQIKQALLNIVLNASEAMSPKGGGIQIFTLNSKSKIEICIQDNGPGIPPEKLPYIFDPFFTDKDGGTGLGLSVTHSLIEGNGGKISVETSGQGAQFRVYL